MPLGPGVTAARPTLHSLASIHVAGYKSIRDQALELGSLNVLIGANGAGKSNFISVFRLLNEIVESHLQVFVGQAGGADRLLHLGRKVTDAIKLELYFGPNSYSCRLVPTSQDRLIFEDERISYQDRRHSRPYDVALGTGREETGLYDEIARREGKSIAEYVLHSLRSWKIYHFHDTSASAKVKQTGDLADDLYLRPDGGNLAAFLHRLQETDPRVFRKIEDTIQTVAPFFGRFNLQPDRRNSRKIRLEWQEKSSDTYFDAHALSDGTLRFMSLATLLLQPELPTTLLIDEPELGLHPYAITLLADLFRAASTRTQLVVSTQSVTLVNQLTPEEIVVVDRQDGESIFRRLQEDEIATWLDDYALGELWEKNVLGGRPHP
jgi:predicted ATPase